MRITVTSKAKLSIENHILKPWSYVFRLDQKHIFEWVRAIYVPIAVIPSDYAIGCGDESRCEIARGTGRIGKGMLDFAWFMV